MAESTLSVTRVELLRSVGRMLGMRRDAQWPATEKIDVDDVVDVGCRRAYSPPVLPGELHSHDWSFLKPVLTSFQINAPYATGTVSVSSGSVTLTGGTFPTWSAEAEIVIDGVSYSVATRNSATSLTLDNTSVIVAAGTTYSLSKIDYQLPDLWGSFVGDLYYRETDSYSAPIERVDMEGPSGMLALRQSDTFTSRPTKYAVWTTEQTGASGQRWMLALWPRPDADATLIAKYSIYPNKLSSVLPIPAGGFIFSEVLRESCLAAAETEIKGEVGIHSQLFLQYLQAAVSADRRASNPGILGTLNKRYDYSWEPWHNWEWSRSRDRTLVTYL